MSTVNTNFSINNIPQIDRYQNETHKAPTIDLVQKEQINQNEAMMDLKRPVEIKNSNLTVDRDDKKKKKVSKKQQHKKNKPFSKKKEKSKGFQGDNGFFVDVEC